MGARDCGKETAEESAAVRGHRLYKEGEKARKAGGVGQSAVTLNVKKTKVIRSGRVMRLMLTTQGQGGDKTEVASPGHSGCTAQGKARTGHTNLDPETGAPDITNEGFEAEASQHRTEVREAGVQTQVLGGTCLGPAPTSLTCSASYS